MTSSTFGNVGCSDTVGPGVGRRVAVGLKVGAEAQPAYAAPSAT